MNQKHQVGGSDKDFIAIKSGQKNHESYGLPSAKDYSTELLDEAPEVLVGMKSLENALKKADELLLRGQEWRLVKTPYEPVIIDRRCLRHIFMKRDQQREKFINWIIPTLTDPNEIWLTEYEDGFRRHFIKFFKGKKNMLVIARENKDGSFLWNAIPTSRIDYIDGRRKGRLLYKKRGLREAGPKWLGI